MEIENHEERKKRKKKERNQRREERLRNERIAKERLRNERIINEESYREGNEKLTEIYKLKSKCKNQGRSEMIIETPSIVGIEPINITHIPIHDKPQEKKKSNLACKALRNLNR